MFKSAEPMLVVHVMECPVCWRKWLLQEEGSCGTGSFLLTAMEASKAYDLAGSSV